MPFFITARFKKALLVALAPTVTLAVVQSEGAFLISRHRAKIRVTVAP